MHVYLCHFIRLIRPSLILLMAFGLPGTALATSPNAEQWRHFNIRTVDHYIIPRYQNFAEETATLEHAAQNFCQQTNGSNFSELQEAFKTSMLAWQSIQNVRFGPVETFMRIFAIQFWPDKKNHTEKQLRQLINSEDPQRLSIDALHAASVSVRGLPALERMLFASNSETNLSEHAFQCRIVISISAYLAHNARNMVTEWRLDMRPQFAEKDPLDSYFEDDIDAATALIKVLVEPIEVIKDLKLKRVLGNSVEQVKPKRLESWRSELSLRNLDANIHSLEAMFQGPEPGDGLAPLLDTSDREKISTAFNELKTTLAELSHLGSGDQTGILYYTLSSQEGYQLASRLVSQLDALHDMLETAVSELGIHLGFNSRDGD